MSKMDCETIRQADMALADGETASLNAEHVQMHLAECLECRRTVAELRTLNSALDAQSRRVEPVDFWPRIQSRLAAPAAETKSSSMAGMIAMLVMTLLLVRGMVLTTAHPLEWVVRLVALFFVLGWFFLLRENPFAVHPHLVEGKETRS
jgi:predicted anti-sigma-YlaC factor YlaD